MVWLRMLLRNMESRRKVPSETASSWQRFSNFVAGGKQLFSMSKLSWGNSKPGLKVNRLKMWSYLG